MEEVCSKGCEEMEGGSRYVSNFIQLPSRPMRKKVDLKL